MTVFDRAAGLGGMIEALQDKEGGRPPRPRDVQKEDLQRARSPLIPWHGRTLRLERIIDRHHKAEGTTAKDLMTPNVITATEATGSRELAHLMVTHDVKRIPILRDGRVVDGE